VPAHGTAGRSDGTRGTALADRKHPRLRSLPVRPYLHIGARTGVPRARSFFGQPRRSRQLLRLRLSARRPGSLQLGREERRTPRRPVRRLGRCVGCLFVSARQDKSGRRYEASARVPPLLADSGMPGDAVPDRHLGAAHATIRRWMRRGQQAGRLSWQGAAPPALLPYLGGGVSGPALPGSRPTMRPGVGRSSVETTPMLDLPAANGPSA